MEVSKNELFVIAGAGKAGTSALSVYLNQHPKVCISPSEVHFFDTNRYQDDREAYLNSLGFSSRKCKVIGDKTPSYLYVPFVPKRIHSLDLQIKVVISVRDPIERAFSDWWMNYCRGVEKLSFSEAMDKNINRIEDEGPAYDTYSKKDFYEYINNWTHSLLFRTYIESGHYSTLAEKYVEELGRNNVKVVPFRGVVGQNNKSVKNVAQFLGLNGNYNINDSDPVNSSFNSRSLGLLAQYMHKIGLVRMVPRPIRKTVKKAVGPLGEKPQPPKSTIKTLSSYYNTRNKRLSDEWDIDTSDWR
ncbi:sulfotransferase domain-containing protein [Salinibacter ruber]|uniref:sulfotransferase domain-containing protein n=1 Tax=Salinibacter ruber TaxID=146919 RepID=UPI0021691D62|nr:sulfotransferase domain-containing protein [Salinibacter ruber]MCS4054464.1 hypothetical protein [Salinibacter ruber]